MAGCVVCHRSSPIKRCSRCHIPQYCSVACQKANWASHKNDCEPERNTRVHLETRPGGPSNSRPAPDASDVAQHLLSNISNDEAYRRLIDTFRLRASDTLTMGGAGEVGFSYDMRTGGPPKDEFHNFLVKARKNDLLPPWFDGNAQHTCMDIAMDPQKDLYIGYSIDIQDIENEYKDKAIAVEMRAVAAHAMGKEYRFDDPAYADMSQDTLRFMMEHQKQNLARQGIKVLPRRPGKERPVGQGADDSNDMAAMQCQMAHYMDDFKTVAHRMSIEEYGALLREHKFNSIKDIEHRA